MKQSNVYRFLVPGFICVAMASGAARKTSHKMGSRLDACPHGLSQYQSGDVLMAVKTLKQCLEENPKNHSAWVAIASAYSEIGHFPEAVNAYGQANSLIPGNSATLTGQIDALQSMGATQEQIPLWRQLFALNPTDPVLAKSFLAILDSMGPEKYPEEYSNV
jgi:tetratricopeptide (TPR) repeat protein